jgi:hypothetical protein
MYRGFAFLFFPLPQILSEPFGLHYNYSNICAKIYKKIKNRLKNQKTREKCRMNVVKYSSPLYSAQDGV